MVPQYKKPKRGCVHVKPPIATTRGDTHLVAIEREPGPPAYDPRRDVPQDGRGHRGHLWLRIP
jgi:hypothetical protein